MGEGTPLHGDRSAWNVADYPDEHTNEYDAEEWLYHTPLSVYDAVAAPTTGDDSNDGYAPGSRWVDVTNDKAYVCLDASVGAAIWLEIMDVGDYDEDGDGLVDAAHGGTELDTSLASGVATISAGTWSILAELSAALGGTGQDTSGDSGIAHVSGGTWSVVPRVSPGADSEVTIDGAGEITVTQFYHRVDTNADGASDDLDTINGLANDGELLILHPENDARTVVLKHGTGNIYVPGGSDITMDDYEYHVLLIYDAESTSWCVVGAGGGGAGGTDADAIHVDVAAEISGIANKAAPTGYDMLVIEDAADGDAKKMIYVDDIPIADHDHSGDAGDGGQLDWDEVWSDAVHNHSADAEGGTFDAANLTSGASTDGQVLTSDGAGNAAWEDPPAGGVVDADDVTYTPTTAADWDGSADPGNADDAFDQLAERVKDLEDAGGGGGAGILEVQVFF